MTSLTLITPPTTEPVTLAEAKAYLRVDYDTDDALIQELIKSARLLIEGKEGWLWRVLVTQTWRLTLDAFPTDEIEIPFPPLQSISSVKYDAASDGTETTLDPSMYTVDNVSEPGWLLFNTGGAWPSTYDAVNAVRIDFIAGYGAASAVPESIKVAIKEIVAHVYENRGSVQLPEIARKLLYNYRVKWVA